jgi:hypothetical protein
MAVALLLGWLVGYERYFKGRAAGSQVYCLVCVTSCAVTLLAGFPSLWYWGQSSDTGGADPTKVIAPILTGIGFLGAGIIVKSGLNVRGLTTAASIWGSSAIGLLVGAHGALRRLRRDHPLDRAAPPGTRRDLDEPALSRGLQADPRRRPSLCRVARHDHPGGQRLDRLRRSPFRHRVPDPREVRRTERHLVEHR